MSQVQVLFSSRIKQMGKPQHIKAGHFCTNLFYNLWSVRSIMKDEKNELIYLGIMIVLMIGANVFIHLTAQEQLKQFVPYLVPTTLFLFLFHFLFRRHILRKKFKKVLEKLIFDDNN